jgi:hypothetical protein
MLETLCPWRCGDGFDQRRNAVDAVDLLRSNVRSRIEVASIEHVCKVDIKK